MAIYQRFVTYLFGYTDRKKGKNCGFAKVESRADVCRIRIQISHIPDGEYPVCLFREIGGGKEYDRTQSEEERPPVRITGEPVGRITVQNGMGSALLQTNIGAEQQDVSVRELYGGVYIAIQEDTFIASQWNDREIDWGSFHVAQERSESGDAAPDLMHEIRVGEEQDLQATGIAGSAAGDRTAGPYPERRSTPYFDAWEAQWERFVQNHPVCRPCGTDSAVRAVKLTLHDFRVIDRRLRTLVNNSFLLHGYFQHQHVIFGCEEIPGASEEGAMRRFFLGIPGAYYQQEQLLAAMFGFPEFLAADGSGATAEGTRGYWCLSLEFF